jgi:hypothetical protein
VTENGRLPLPLSGHGTKLVGPSEEQLSQNGRFFPLWHTSSSYSQHGTPLVVEGSNIAVSGAELYAK